MTIDLNIPENMAASPGKRLLLAPGHTGTECCLRLPKPFPIRLDAGSFLGSKREVPLFRIEGCFWWPFSNDQGLAAGRAYWVSPMAEIEPGKLSLDVWKEGLSLAWITISDKGAAGERVDSGGPLIESLVSEKMRICLSRGAILPDDADEIKSLLISLALVEGFDLILTTGGTGPAPRDVTPEATQAVIEKRLYGFEQAMMLASLSKTPHGALSRAVAGVLGRSVILNLPGSPRAVSENLEAVLPALKHCVGKVQGDASDCAELREKSDG